MVNFFIHRPVFASVIAIIMGLTGLIVYSGLLPVAQFPDITPPQVVVTTTYPGASSQVVANTVTTPLEQQINGVTGMAVYALRSAPMTAARPSPSRSMSVIRSIPPRSMCRTASPRSAQLPAIVNQAGIIITKKNPTSCWGSTSLRRVVRSISATLSNYAYLQLIDPLKRLPGVGDVNIFGRGAPLLDARVWLDPDKLATLGITAMDVQQAIEEQNIQKAAAGRLGQAPAPPGTQFEFQVDAVGRLSDPQQFGNIVSAPGRRAKPWCGCTTSRVSSLAPCRATSSARFNDKPMVFIAVYQTPGSNALQVDQEIRTRMAELAKRFPTDVAWGDQLRHDDFRLGVYV